MAAATLQNLTDWLTTSGVGAVLDAAMAICDAGPSGTSGPVNPGPTGARTMLQELAARVATARANNALPSAPTSWPFPAGASSVQQDWTAILASWLTWNYPT